MKNIERFIIAVPLCFTILVGWFSYNAYYSAPEIAEENLRGAGLSIAASIEQLIAANQDFKSLRKYSTPDIAYFSITDINKTILFHTNPALIGSVFNGSSQINDKLNGINEGRKRLGTGEEVYLLQSQIHANQNDYLLHLALHTYRADRVVRRANTGVTVVALLTFSLWIVTIGVMFLLRRDEKRKEELTKRAELVRLGELGAIMAHEIRNPLAGIKGYAQLIEFAEDTEQARLYADKIVSQSIRMELLVNDLLAFVREDNGYRAAADISILLRDCLELIKMEAEEAGIEICYKTETEIKVMVVSDRIIQLLLNLLKNAIQAMPDGGKLMIELATSKSSVIITIQDTGVGIPHENLVHIFEPFWTNKARGSGLGLALCRKVAIEHGGALSVDSRVGIGTTFTIKLPLEN